MNIEKCHICSKEIDTDEGYEYHCNICGKCCCNNCWTIVKYKSGYTRLNCNNCGVGIDIMKYKKITSTTIDDFFKKEK